MAILSLNEILKSEIQEYLGGSEAILVKTITDLSARVRPGMDRVTVPRISGLALANITAGTRATAGGMTTAGDALLLDQSKQVPEYISYDDGLESAVDLKAAFLEAAPRVFAQGIEAALAAALETDGTAANNFESPSAGAGVFSVDDFGTSKRILDVANVPSSERYAALNPVDMERLAGFSEFEDGQKSLSDQALKDGIVTRIKGFNVVMSNDITSGVITCYHKSAVAYAMQDGVSFIEKMNEEFAQEFVALRGKYGVKALDNGERRVSILTAV